MQQHNRHESKRRKQEQDGELTDQYLTLLHRLHRSVVGLAHIAQTPFPAGGEAAAAAAAGAAAGAAATTATSSSASFGAGRASGAAHSGGASGTSEARTNTPPYWP